MQKSEPSVNEAAEVYRRKIICPHFYSFLQSLIQPKLQASTILL